MAVNPTPTSVQQNLPAPYIEGALTALSERLLPLLSTSELQLTQHLRMHLKLQE
jgi:hypothetical protein